METPTTFWLVYVAFTRGATVAFVVSTVVGVVDGAAVVVIWGEAGGQIYTHGNINIL